MADRYQLKSVVAVTDLSAGDVAALRRAAQLANQHRCGAKLLYMPTAGRPPVVAAASRLAAVVRQFEEDLGRRAMLVSRVHCFEQLVRHATDAGLLVLPHRRERGTAAFLRGQPVTRLLRCCDVPVLVVRRTQAGDDQRVLVVADATNAAANLMQYAGRFAPGAEASMLEPPRFGWHPLRRDAAAAADLVVVGKARRARWHDWVRGSAAQQVLRWSRSDVLIVPHATLTATAPLAARRLGQGSEAAAHGEQDREQGWLSRPHYDRFAGPDAGAKAPVQAAMREESL